MTKLRPLALLGLLASIALTSAKNGKRDEIIAFWTPERMAMANSLLPLLGEGADEESVYVSYRVGPGSSLFKLRRRDGKKNAKGNKKSGLRRLSLLSPSNDETFDDPRTVTFQATTETLATLTDLSFVFELNGVATPVTVAADEIDENDVATEMVGGFASGNWEWYLQGIDAQGNTVKSAKNTFIIENSNYDETGRRLEEENVGEADWDFGGEGGGQIQKAAGRIYFQDSAGSWLCSGTAIKDFKTGRSLILTAAHCLYWDDFAFNVLFIPDRDSTTGDSTRDCTADPCGCWTTSGAVALDGWKQTGWPGRIPWDYGFYIVDDTGSHAGNKCNPDSEALDKSVDAMSFVVDTPVVDERIYGLGYPANHDPLFKFCTEPATTLARSWGVSWWMDQCAMLGGSSGGPWVKNMDINKGTGQVVGVNSWGFSSRAGMGAAIINATEARCMINYARNAMNIIELESRPNGQQGDFIPLGECTTAFDDDIQLVATEMVETTATLQVVGDLSGVSDETLIQAFTAGLPEGDIEVMSITLNRGSRRRKLEETYSLEFIVLSEQPTDTALIEMDGNEDSFEDSFAAAVNEAVPNSVSATTVTSLEQQLASTTGDGGPGSASGDPHFKTWTGIKFDYHGECDLVLVDSPSFNNGQGLKLHIRTTRVKYFSFIETIALQIGSDILEFDNDMENLMINGMKLEENKKFHKTFFAGFPVRRDPRAISIRLTGQQGPLGQLIGGAKIDFHTRKNGFPAVVLDPADTDIFKGSLGLLGEWHTGRTLARDGKTVIPVSKFDSTDYALEWQVRDTEPMLFSEYRSPQFPNACIPPEKMKMNGLGKSLVRQEAEEACAHWKQDKEDCIFDVIATQDVLVAEEGHIIHIE